MANQESRDFAACGNFREKVVEGLKPPLFAPISASSYLSGVLDVSQVTAVNPG
jgi:hypothetical protein